VSPSSTTSSCRKEAASEWPSSWRSSQAFFAPPFENSSPSPGYIQAYPPGVRENGGQYTHAALWLAMATARAGDGTRAVELLRMLSPVERSRDPEAARRYATEPYAVAGDVYDHPAHRGRGGWTWYTGAAGWMYRLVVETLLGLHLEADKLRLAPLMPRDWESYKIHYRYRETFYHLTVKRAGPEAKAVRVTVDGVEQPSPAVPLADDHRDHDVEVLVPAAP